MTKEAAIQQFFSQFGIPAFSSDTKIEDEIIPDPNNFTSGYLIHNIPTASFEDGPVSGTVYLRYYTESEAIINEKAQEISDRIGMGGVDLPCNGGFIWINRDVPFKINAPQEEGTEESRFLKTKQLNITAEYFTLN